MKKFTTEQLAEMSEFVTKEYAKTPSRARLAGDVKDLTISEAQAVIFFNAAATVLNKMGALKEGALETVLPQLEVRTQQSVWDE